MDTCTVCNNGVLTQTVIERSGGWFQNFYDSIELVDCTNKNCDVHKAYKRRTSRFTEDRNIKKAKK